MQRLGSSLIRPWVFRPMLNQMRLSSEQAATATTSSPVKYKLITIFSLISHQLFYLKQKPKTSSPEDIAEIPKGTPAKLIPAFVKLEEGKIYSWCSCGSSSKKVSF